MNLPEFPDECFPNTVTFYPAAYVLSGKGADKPSYSGPGVTVKASVQPVSVSRSEPDGVVTGTTIFNIFMKMSVYNTLGQAVMMDDHFIWVDGGGRVLGSQGPMQDRGGRGITAWITAQEIVAG